LADWLDGDEALLRRLDALGSDRQKLGLIGLAAVKEGKVLVPRRTGNLGRTIRLGTVTDAYADVLAGGRLKVGYAAAVELGTRAQPYLVPGIKKALRRAGMDVLIRDPWNRAA
jgi:hypothetical protein